MTVFRPAPSTGPRLPRIVAPHTPLEDSIQKRHTIVRHAIDALFAGNLFQQSCHPEIEINSAQMRRPQPKCADRRSEGAQPLVIRCRESGHLRVECISFDSVQVEDPRNPGRADIPHRCVGGTVQRRESRRRTGLLYPILSRITCTAFWRRATPIRWVLEMETHFESPS